MEPNRPFSWEAIVRHEILPGDSADVRILLRLIARGALADFNPSAVSTTTGATLCCCGDCHRSDELIAHERKVVHPHAQLISFNGAPLYTSDRSPLVRSNRGVNDLILENVAENPDLKGIYLVLLVGHHPCGKAKKIGLGALGNLRTTLDGKRTLRARLEEEHQEIASQIRIVVKFHVDWATLTGNPEDGRRTYFVDRHALPQAVRRNREATLLQATTA